MHPFFKNIAISSQNAYDKTYIKEVVHLLKYGYHAMCQPHA
jgi:hypothetical protein